MGFMKMQKKNLCSLTKGSSMEACHPPRALAGAGGGGQGRENSKENTGKY